MSCHIRLLPLFFVAAMPIICTSFASQHTMPTISSSRYYRSHHIHDVVELRATQRNNESLDRDLDLDLEDDQRRRLLGEKKTTTRRDVLFGATNTVMAVACSSIMLPTVAIAAEEEETVLLLPQHHNAQQQQPKIKAVVTLNLSIARGPSRPLHIELFQDAPMASVEFFTSLANGKLKAPCAMGDNSNIEICEDYQSIDVGYKGSQLWRLVPNKRMDFGRVDSMFTSRIPPNIAVEDQQQNNNDLLVFKPSTRGAVSIKRGGGAFEFTVTPSYNLSLDTDREDLVVVGRIAEDDMPFIDEINAIPVRKDIVKLGDVPPLGSNFARACDFTAPDSTCAQFKPLKRIIVTESSVVVATTGL